MLASRSVNTDSATQAWSKFQSAFDIYMLFELLLQTGGKLLQAGRFAWLVQAFVPPSYT